MGSESSRPSIGTGNSPAGYGHFRPASSLSFSSPRVVNPLSRPPSHEATDSTNREIATPLGSERHRNKHGGVASPPSSPSKKLGLWNVGNTCYTNSVLQVLYESSIFRECCENEAEMKSADEGGLLNALGQLFLEISAAKKTKRTAHINPNKFIQRLKEKNSIFRPPDHHDAHEFYSCLMNTIGDELLQRKEGPIGPHTTQPCLPVPLPTPSRISSHRWRSKKVSPMDATGPPNGTALKTGGSFGHSTPSSPKRTFFHLESFPSVHRTTWLHELFQGYLVYETRCLSCENITRRREQFFDVPLDIETDRAASLSACIRHFARTELLKGKDKYFCEFCCCLQEAERSLRFERLPRVLAIHLKRFKYEEARGCYSRVASRVEYPSTLYFPSDALATDHPSHSLSSRSRTRDSSSSSFHYHHELALSSAGRSTDGSLTGAGKVEGEGGFRDRADSSGQRKKVDTQDFKLQLSNNSTQAGPEFDLFGVVVHIGTSMSHGHYVSCVRDDDHCWWLYDDHDVKSISSSTLSSFYGSSDTTAGAKCGYLLFYTSRAPFPLKPRPPSTSRWPQLMQSLNFIKQPNSD